MPQGVGYDIGKLQRRYKTAGKQLGSKPKKKSLFKRSRGTPVIIHGAKTLKELLGSRNFLKS